jgi:endonuclease YncB( thermonuclease family)
MHILVLIFFLGLWDVSASAKAWDLSSYAFVNDDGTLRIRGKTIHLYGILIPATETSCQTFVLPLRCGSRAALALDFKIGANFVHCDVKSENPDRTLNAICSVDGEDLAAYLLQLGWAAADPQGPPEYEVLERIARHRGLGVWGIPVDNIR